MTQWFGLAAAEYGDDADIFGENIILLLLKIWNNF